MANGEPVADSLWTVCQAHWTAPTTLAHHPVRLARWTAQFGQAGAGGPRYRLFSPRSSGRRPLALLCPPKQEALACIQAARWTSAGSIPTLPNSSSGARRIGPWAL